MKKHFPLLLFSLSVISHYSLAQGQYSIVIDEIMADPSPQLGLPGREWIEIKNVGPAPVNLRGWRIGDASGISGPLTDFTLQPDSFAIICSSGSVPDLQAFGQVLSVTSFPSLNNNGELLFISNSSNATIHALQFDVSWYQNPVKADGGWTLEMIDTKNPCSGFSNWKASMDMKGGTPGERNSVDGDNADDISPGLIKAYAIDASNLVLLFDEPLDSSSAALANAYSISDGIGHPGLATPLGPLFNKVNLFLNSPLQQDKVYTITVNGITDCSNNTVGVDNAARIGLALMAEPKDVVINEILFNPKSNGYDYVELYNRSEKVLDFNQLYLSNRDNSGQLANIKKLSEEPLLFFPGDFMVITENQSWVKKNYTVKNFKQFIGLSSLPAYPDDKGFVVLLNASGEIVDETDYDEGWHFKLIDDNNGVALERIDYAVESQNAGNWHSAASDAGYGTPTYQNSQYRADRQVQGAIEISPKVFSPDNDGYDDFITITYQFPESGYVANITIYDAAGRQVRYLQRNALLGTMGHFRWDGLDEKFNKLPVGIYIIVSEVFNLTGKTKEYKQALTLARKLR